MSAPIAVTIEKKSQLWYATSDDIKGIHLAFPQLDTLVTETLLAIGHLRGKSSDPVVFTINMISEMPK